MGSGIVFHDATVYQERNEHNLLRDFQDEVPGYLHNDRMRVELEACRLDSKDLERNLVICYEKLTEGAFIPEKELPLLKQWCAAVNRVLQ